MEEIIVNSSELILRDLDSDLEFIFLFMPNLPYRAFYGDASPESHPCIGINLADKLLKYAATKSVEATSFHLSYLVLHELTHWATDDNKQHKHWCEYLFRLLFRLETETE